MSCGLSKKRLLACAIALTLVLSAAVGTAGAGAAPAAAQGLNGPKFIAFVNSLAQIAARDRSSCTKMAVDLKAYVASHRGEIATFKAEASHMTRAQKLVFAERYGAKLETAIGNFTRNVVACVLNPAVRAALATLKAIKTS